MNQDRIIITIRIRITTLLHDLHFYLRFGKRDQAGSVKHKFIWYWLTARLEDTPLYSVKTHLFFLSAFVIH